MSGEQFDDPNREAVGLPPIGAEPDEGTPTKTETEPEAKPAKRGKADDDEADEADDE